MSVETVKPGYVLALALMVMSLSVIMLTSIFYKSIVHYKYSTYFMRREKAQWLALSGIEIARAQLGITEPKKQRESTKEKKEHIQDSALNNTQETASQEISTKKVRIGKKLKLVNRWQTFTLQERTDGIDATIKIFIACEHGKVNINQLYNFNQRQFITQGPFDALAFYTMFFNRLTPLVHQKNLLDAFVQFLKNRGYELDDVTSLNVKQEFSVFANRIVREPEQQASAKQVYLMDLFTLDSERMTLDPLFLSVSIQTLLGLRQHHMRDYEHVLKDWNEGMPWEQAWDKVLAPLYGKEYTVLPEELKPLLSSQVEPSVFSVISYATVGEMTQKMYAIVQKDRLSNQYEVKKVYWI